MAVVQATLPEAIGPPGAPDRRDGVGVPARRRCHAVAGARRARPSQLDAADDSVRLADAARGRYADLRQRQQHGDRRRRRADRLWRQQAGRQAGRLQPQDRHGWSPAATSRSIDSTGTKVYSDEIDITDDFADGFVNALRVETVDKTYFAAESAEREGGKLTTFNNGVYTACEPCEEKPDQAPIWRIKAQKIIWNGKAKTVRFENSRFELFGMPIAYFPAFEMPDPTVKRKTGFLIPGVTYKSDLGVGVDRPVLRRAVADLRPDVDRPLLHQAGLPRQGRMAAALQQRLLQCSGIAGIDQQDPEAFDSAHRRLADRRTTPTSCAA